MPEITYTAPPVCGQFMRSDSFGRLIAGPVGSGKTTACIFELLRRACEQAPAPDGFRYTRMAIVRQTLKALKDTVLKDVVSWLSAIAKFKVSDSTIFIEFDDVRSEWILIPLDDPEDQRRLLSMQLTGAWLSEAIEMDTQIISPLAGRVGRYPGASLGGASWFGLIADTNFPSEGSPWHNFMEISTPVDWQVFKQPGGMDEGAENLEWLTQTPETLKLPVNDPKRRAQGRTYYERFIRSNSPDWCTRYVHAQYGPDPSGSAVFRDSFKASFHCVDELEPVHGHPLIVGQDFGRNPCAVICQVDHRGRLLVLEEVPTEDLGLELHIQRYLKPQLQHPRYLGRAVYVVGDPAGNQRSTSYEETSFDLLKRNGIMAFPAVTNQLDKRLQAVEAFLLRQADGGPAFLLDKTRCPNLYLALSGQYRYAKTRSGQQKPLPDKSHPWSDLADALQYVALSAHGGYTQHISNNLLTRRPVTAPRPVNTRGWT
jgi:hypothetical protein